MDLDLPVLNVSGSILFFNRLSYQAANGKLLVDDVSVNIKAGQMLAVMVRARCSVDE